jgi:hypothetical protein
MQKAVNPQTGEVLFLVDNQWVKPTQTAINPDTGENAFLVNNAWQVMPMPKPAEPIVSPEEQMMSSVGQTSQQQPSAGVLSGTTLPANPPPMGNRDISEVGTALPITKDLPKLDVSQMPTAEERAVANFGISPEMGFGEKALRTAKGALYGASTGLEQSWAGGARLIADITGINKEEVASASRQLGKEQAAVEKTYAPEYGFKIAKDIGSSVVQNIPTIGAGLYAGTSSALTNMFLQSFTQTYDDSRNEGLGVGESTVRSTLYGTAEALGESLGLPNLLKGVKGALKGVPTVDLAKDMAKYILKEIPGEQFTYVSQFLTDKGFGLNPEAGLTEFLQGAQDTALVTVGQTAIMGGGLGATNKILKELRGLHSKGDEGIPNAADMVKQAGFNFQRPEPQGQVTIQGAPPEAVMPPQTAPTAPGEVAPSRAVIQEGEIEVPEEEGVTAVTPTTVVPKKPTFVKKPNDPAIEAEAIAIADELDKLGEKGFAIGFRSKIEKDGGLTKSEDLNFYRNKLLEAQQKAGKAEEMPQEKFNIENYLPSSNKAEVKRFNQYVPNAPEPVREMVGKSNEYLQKLTDKINSLGYKVLDVDTRAPQEIQELKRKISNIAGSTFAYTKNAEHIDKNNRFANPDKFENIAQTLEKDFADADQLLGIEAAKPQATEVVTEEEQLPKFSQAENVPVIPEGQTVDSTNPEVLKKFNEIIETYEPESGISQEDSFLSAINEDVQSKIEETKAPPFKKGYVSTVSYEVAPFNGGWVGGSSIMSATGGYASGASIWDKVYPTKQEAINAQIDELRDSAKIYGNTKALAWLDSVDPRLTKESKIETNKVRQTEKKTKAKPIEKPVERVKPVEAKEEKPVTTEALEKAVTKAGEKVDYDKIKKSAENQINQAIKRTKYMTEEAYKDAKIPDAERFVTIKLEGDGSFKVKNNKERLEEFKKKLVNAIKPKQAGTPRREWESAAVGFKADSAFKNFLNEKEPETAIAIANLTKLDIKKVKLNDAQQKVLNDYIKAAKEVGNEPMMETIKSKPGANVARIAKLLGPQLYGSMSDISNVSVKEMLQNSFDAIKTMIENGTITQGNINIDVDKDTRTIAVTDDGSGMDSDVLANTFFTIAGTKKETEFGSGGFGIAKMLFLFGNENVEVITMRDGKISSMQSTGKNLMAALEDPAFAPNIEVDDKSEWPDYEKMFPKGHGTFVRVTVPKEYKDQSTGEMKEIKFTDSKYAYPVLENSPLFANINVKFNDDTVWDMGTEFPANEYTTFVDANFDWGTARIYVSKDQKDQWGDNLHILSNGLWQFSQGMKLNPMEMFGKNIPHRFYLDVVSKVKPDEEGYPFQLNRQGFTKEAESDLDLIKKYLTLHYQQKDFDTSAKTFGTVQYLGRERSLFGKDKGISVSETINLIPESPKVKEVDGIEEGSQVEVKNGKLIVNGKVVPVLTPEDMKKAAINIDELQIPQSSINPKKVMIHDNLEVKNTDGTFSPITQLAIDEFGERFHDFMFNLGDAFMALRDATARLMPADRKGIDYKNLAKEAIGISFDKEYRGVSITLPFKGLFINPAFPEFIDTPEEAALGMFGTMIHELAHHKVRNHGADFPAEMQRIIIKLESAPSLDIQQLKKDLILTVKENMDIIKFLNKEGSNESNRPIGQRFKDSQYQKRGEDTSADLSKRGKQQRGEPRVSSESESGIEDIREERELEPVSSEGKGSKSDIEEVQNLLKKHARSNTPLHPSNEVADAFMGSVQKGKKIYSRVKENPMMVAPAMISKLDRATTFARNKNIWYGTGLEQADFAKYNGQLRTGQGDAIASLAVTNAIHAGHVGTQVLIEGNLQYNPVTQQFQSVKSDKSMANVITLKSKLMKKLGDQEATDLINGYFEAKRSRSIINEYLNREGAYVKAIEEGEDEATASKNLKNIEVAMQKVNMDDDQIDEFIAMDKKFPELRQMMDNWTAVNHNMLDNMVFSGVISKRRAKDLKAIKDYVPWYRIMDEQADIHQPTGGVVRTLTNVSQDKKFKKGVVNRDIDDIVDNMIHNVMMMTRNSMRNYAANRVVAEYGTRKENGKLKVFSTEGRDSDGVRFNIIANGRRIIVQIKDPLIAESVIGMENIEIPMNKILAAMANGLRRTITFSGVFQVKQLFMDAPTAAWVSGLKNPFAVWGGTFSSFLQALRNNDPIVKMFKSYGIGGFQSTSRTPEKELKLEIGLLNHSNYAKLIKFLDHVGDSSDYAQRRAIYKRVMKETSKTGKWQDGDQMQALLQANNVIDFLKHGSGQTAQFLTRTVSFMNAYAQQIDVLAQTLAGGGLKGKDRQEGLKRMAITGGLLSMTTLLYCMAVGADDDYQELDDQTKARNLYIPGSKKAFGHAVVLPMHTSASFFFKAIPELLYNKVMNQGTNNEMDNTRLRTALKEAAIDSLLGPNAVPTGAKPFIEIGLNRNFFTGGQLTPKGMENLEAVEQYTSATSELGKVFSALTSVPGTDKRALNPIEADHLMRSLFGSVAAMSMWGSNMFAGDRPEGRVKDIPVIGQFVLPEVPRGNEAMFYDFKERSDEKYNTYMRMLDRNKIDEADQYLEKNMGLVAAHDYVTSMDSGLKELNKQIRNIGETKDPDYTKSERRKDITDLQETKKDILDGIGLIRKDSGL